MTQPKYHVPKTEELPYEDRLQAAITLYKANFGTKEEISIRKVALRHGCARKQCKIELKVQYLRSWQVKRYKDCWFLKRVLSSNTTYSYIGGDDLQRLP